MFNLGSSYFHVPLTVRHLLNVSYAGLVYSLMQVYNSKIFVGIFFPWLLGWFPFPSTFIPSPSHPIPKLEFYSHSQWESHSHGHLYSLMKIQFLTPAVYFSIVFIRPCMLYMYTCKWSPLLQEAQLSPRDRAMRRVNWNLANWHATVQKLLIRQVLTISMVWSLRFSRRQCVIDNVHSTMTRSSRLPLSQVS